MASVSALEVAKPSTYTEPLNTCGKGIAMFSVADLLDRAMRGGNIDTHYRLAKVIGISQGTMTGYKAGKSMPDARVLEQLCALSGDDVAVVMAQIQAERERTPEGKSMWLMVARRLAGHAQPAILAALFAIALIAFSAMPARAAELQSIQKPRLDSLYIVSTGRFGQFVNCLLVRLRRYAGFLGLSFGLCTTL